MACAPLPTPLALYRFVTGHAAPILEQLLKLRLAWGKEDALRLGERRGEAEQLRKEGFLAWIHAASVGEASSVLTLLEALLKHGVENILVTTTTVTAASLLAMRMTEARALHQFLPLDHPRWVERFLDHWRPDLGLIVESELWPNLLLSAKAKDIPLVLVNARLSQRSYRRWRCAPQAAARLLSCFALCVAQDQKTAARLSALGAARVVFCGNLKLSAHPLPDLPADRARLEALLQGRPRLVAASTHDGEELVIANAAGALKRRYPDLALVLAPRHPERGPELADSLRKAGYSVALRSRSEQISATTDIYVADTLGELGLFYRLSPFAFMGGSLVPHGGQNPLEPARLGRFVLHGPHVENFAESYAALHAAGAAQEVDSASLAEALEALFTDPEGMRTRGEQAASVVRAADQVLTCVLAELKPFLPSQATSGRDGCT